MLNSHADDAPGLVRWWQGIGCMINVTDDRAVKWFAAKLENLRAIGIDSFKFDAGEASYMPQGECQCSDGMSCHQWCLFILSSINALGMASNPNLVTQQYVKAVSQFGGMIETRAAYRNQDSATFVRMMDKHSHWGYDNGLKTMIPSALHLSIIGYHFVIPDMIGK